MARLRRDPPRCSDAKCGCATETTGAACHTARQMFMVAIVSGGLRRRPRESCDEPLLSLASCGCVRDRVRADLRPSDFHSSDCNGVLENGTCCACLVDACKSAEYFDVDRFSFSIDLACGPCICFGSKCVALLDPPDISDKCDIAGQLRRAACAASILGFSAANGSPEHDRMRDAGVSGYRIAEQSFAARGE